MMKRASKRQLEDAKCTDDVNPCDPNVQNVSKKKKLKSNLNNLTVVQNQDTNTPNHKNKLSESVSILKNKKNFKKHENHKYTVKAKKQLNKIKSNGDVKILKKNYEINKDMPKNKKIKGKVNNFIAEQNDNANDSDNVEVPKPFRNKKKTKEAQKNTNVENAETVSAKVKVEKAVTNNKDKNVVKLTNESKKKNVKNQYLKKDQKSEGKHNLSNKLSVSEMKKRIDEIVSRETLSKRAMRKLRVLRKKVKVAEEAADDTPNAEGVNSEAISSDIIVKKKQPTKPIREKKSFLEDRSSNKSLNTTTNSNDNKDEQNKVIISKCKKNIKLFKKMKNKAAKVNIQSQSEKTSDTNDVEDDDLDNTEKSANDDDEDSEENYSKDEEETSDSDKMEVDDEDSNDESPLNISQDINNKEIVTQDLKKQIKNEDNKNSSVNKKQRYVLFVGNLSLDTTAVDIKKHFLSKVSKVKDIRIPLKVDSVIPRGFAYIEVENNIDYEKALSLHQTFIRGRQIKVEYTSCNPKKSLKKQDMVHKNKKLHAIRDAGKLAGSKKNVQKRSFRRNIKNN